MSRYGIKLVPQGVLPRNTEIGVRLTPLAPPPPEIEIEPPPPPPPPDCVVECYSVDVAGWDSVAGVANSVSGSAGFEVAMSGGPWTLQVNMNAQTCGLPITWAFGGTLVDGVDYVSAIGGGNVWLFGPKGCDPPYSGTIDIQGQIDGVAACDLLTITFSGEGGGGASPCCFTTSVGENPCASFVPLPYGPSDSWTITDIGPNAGSGIQLDWSSITNIGDPSVTILPTITWISGDDYLVTYPGPVWTFGAQWICAPTLEGSPYCGDYPVLIFGNDNTPP